MDRGTRRILARAGRDWAEYVSAEDDVALEAVVVAWHQGAQFEWHSSLIRLAWARRLLAESSPTLAGLPLDFHAARMCAVHKLRIRLAELACEHEAALDPARSTIEDEAVTVHAELLELASGIPAEVKTAIKDYLAAALEDPANIVRTPENENRPLRSRGAGVDMRIVLKGDPV